MRKVITNPLHQVRGLGQSLWYDNIRRDLLTSGELARLIELGISGVTSNPTIFEKAIAGSTDYDKALPALSQEGKKVGTSERYHSNGQLKTKNNYKGGKLDGVHEIYHENGYLRHKGNFKEGNLIN